MKITNVEVFMLEKKNLTWHPVGCRIHTDEGIFGDGEAAMCYGIGGRGAYGALMDMAGRIIGMNPLETEVIWEYLYKSTFWGQNGGPMVFSAISAIDIALWDIKGKYYKTPIYTLLGGKQREKLRAYASQLQLGWGRKEDTSYEQCIKPEDFARCAMKAVDEGYDCIKIDFFYYDKDGKFLSYKEQNGLLDASMMQTMEARIKAVRDAIGPDIDLIMENHSFPDANGAVQLGQMAEKYNIFFFEEPNTPTPKTARYIKEKVNIPIASGERIYTRWQYAPYFEDGTIQIIQPDIGNCGGITEAKKICDMAHTYDIGVQAHVCATPLSTDVALHLETAIPNFIIHEHHVCHRVQLTEGYTKYNRQPVNGYISPSDLPGIGNEFLQEAINRADFYCNITEEK